MHAEAERYFGSSDQDDEEEEEEEEENSLGWIRRRRAALIMHRQRQHQRQQYMRRVTSESASRAEEEELEVRKNLVMGPVGARARKLGSRKTVLGSPHHWWRGGFLITDLVQMQKHNVGKRGK